jgi:pyrroline-5-carboxylate reductase
VLSFAKRQSKEQIFEISVASRTLSYTHNNTLKTIGFIGAGKMAQALAGGIAKDFPDLKFVVSDPSADALTTFEEVVQGRSVAADSNQQVFDQSDCVVLAVKPQHAESALQDVTSGSKRPIVVSIMAGVTILKITNMTGSERVIRVMPNTPCLVGQGASGIAANENVDAGDIASVIGLFKSVGKVVEVPEEQIDAVTGVSGSGPAYVFRFIEALIEGGVAEGLAPDVAATLAVQTVRGAAELLGETGESPAVLRDRVTSPGGTTLAALNSLESAGFAAAVIAAVRAATARSKELAAD